MQKSVYKPTIKRRDMDAVLNCLVDESVGPGEYTEVLSKQMASYLGLAGGIALREYRRAVELAIEASELESGDRVLVSALAPFVYGEIIERRGLVAEIHDVELETGNISYDSFERAAEIETKLAISVSPFGIPPNSDIAHIASCAIIEDVSRSLGSKSGESGESGNSGESGRYVVVSLEEDGIVTSGGGALVLARNRRGLGNLKSIADRLTGLSTLGNINASLAAIQLKHIEEFTTRRRSIAEAYVKALAPGRHRAPTAAGSETLSHVTFPVVLAGSQKEAARYARSKGVATAPVFENSIFVRQGLDGAKYPNAQALAMRSLLFPLYPMLKRDEVDRIAKVLRTLP